MFDLYLIDGNARNVYAVDERNAYCAFATDAHDTAYGDEIVTLNGKRIDTGSEPLDSNSLFTCENERFEMVAKIDHDLLAGVALAFGRALA